MLLRSRSVGGNLNNWFVFKVSWRSSIARARGLTLQADMDKLWEVRKKLEGTRQTCAFFDTKRSVRGLEKAYTKMWRRHEWGEAPENFAVQQ